MVCTEYAGLPEKVPLNLVSSGMSKMAAILFAIASKRGSVLLIDEIENGIFHKRLDLFWKSLLDFATETESQVFASTHSGECIRAAATLAEEFPKDFAVVQSDGAGGLHQFDGKSLSAAMRENIEIR
jgi:predicted ATPase